MKLRILLAVVTAVLFGVQGFAQRTIQEFRYAQARAGSGVAEIHVVPIITEVKMKESEGRFKDEWKLTPEDVMGLGGDVSNIKAWATYLSSEEHKCEVVLNPTYMVKTDPKGGVLVTVVGYPGDFTKWHTATKEDFEWLKYEKSWIKSEAETTAPVTAK